ncbi:MAG: hypothetical protein JNL81_01805 [Hyphomonadaceae bacterium]|nr:hypothetical protein [Hyphomonadaceae bacterium]
MRAIVAALTVAAILCLSSCYRTVALDVNELDDGRVKIELRSGLIERFLSGPICFQTIAISERQRGETFDTLSDVWRIERQQPDVCPSEYIFPEVPEGFQLAAGESARLRPGMEYVVRANAPGLDAESNFTKR